MTLISTPVKQQWFSPDDKSH